MADDGVQNPDPPHADDGVQNPDPPHADDGVQNPDPPHADDGVQNPDPPHADHGVQNPHPPHADHGVQNPHPPPPEDEFPDLGQTLDETYRVLLYMVVNLTTTKKSYIRDIISCHYSLEECETFSATLRAQHPTPLTAVQVSKEVVTL